VKGGRVVELYTDQLVTIVEEELLYGKVCGSKRKDSGRVTS
jgi:hypothetical protein